MYTFLLVVHCILAVVITVVVLVQSGKGGGLGAGFGGGGANTLFGSSGGGNFFTKLTMWLAAGFMITSLGLTKVKNLTLKTSIFDTGTATSAPVNAPKGTEPAPLAAPIAPAVPGTPPIAPKTNEPVNKK